MIPINKISLLRINICIKENSQLKATHADSAVNVTKFCADYKRGFVLGYSHRMYEKTGDRQLSAWEAGILTRRYGLDKEMVMDFFRENNSCSTLRFFMAGYRLEN